MKSARLQYVLLVLLFVPTVIYEWHVVQYGLLRLMHPERVVLPPVLLDTASARIRQVFPNAEAAGVRVGDILVSVNGRPYTGLAVGGEELAKRREGDTVTLVVRSPEAAAGRMVAIPLVSRTQTLSASLTWSLKLALAVLYVFLPVLCTVLGFWVVAVRPRDPLAWLLLGVLLSFATILGAAVEIWPAWVRSFAVVYRTVTTTTWPLWMFLFGHYFPAPPGYNEKRWWKWVMWTAVMVVLVQTVIGVIIALGDLNNFAAVAEFNRRTSVLDAPVAIFLYCLVGYFFGVISTKRFVYATADNRRRLRLLYWGATIGLTPMFLLSVIGFVRGKPLESVPTWIFFPSLIALMVFPLTLAYVIVVHRALDVRVVLRQGLKYALATNGMRVIQGLAIGSAVATVVMFAAEPGRNHPERIAVIALAGLVVFAVRRGAQRLKLWVDRQFFRDAYNSEQVLSELSDEVRTMVEVPRLLETVARRISDALHVPRVAVLLGGQPFQPAYALGYDPTPQATFLVSDGTVRFLERTREPARVYFDDPSSWVHSSATEEERGKLAALQAELLLPLAARERLLGFITLGQKMSEEPYSGSDLRLLRSVAAQTGLALENARLTKAIAEEIAQREKLNREVEIAREVQERLFPQKLPEITGVDFFGYCRPASGVAGDYYDFLSLPQSKLGVAVGDVSGKGIAAALLMASLQASLRSQAASAGDDLAGLIRSVNRLVYEASSSNRYATFFYAVYDPATRKLTYVNAGHNPPMLFRKSNGDREVLRLETGGAVVGLLEDFAYQQECISLHPGDVLVAFTDGISEALTAQEEEFGETRLIGAVNEGFSLSVAELVRHILAATDQFTQGAPQHDDLTLVVLRVS